MSSRKSFCPVPFDQQPLNEYKALKKSPLFDCSTADFKTFVKTLALIFMLSIAISFTFSILSLTLTKVSIKIILYNLVFALSSIELALVRLYLGWSYILKRLSSASIFYEESGWYDGQLWIKSADILTQDRLVGIYQVEPFLSRIRGLLIAVSSIFVSVLLILAIYS
uniref:hypothetical protein ycf36 n=1 Tax=Nemalion vermiculare TaxID=935621 RepID=UPI002579758B|nr:hypothetical protein ycf36 [Nemalion vermiculare]WGV34403.1 hypothetical protein ycf36 [Nemalion vermiculare]